MVLFGTINIAKPVTVSLETHDTIAKLFVAGGILWLGNSCIDKLLDCAQKYCGHKVDKIGQLEKECTNKEVMAELHKRAFNFKVLNGLLFIPRIATTITAFTIPVLTLLCIGHELGNINRA